MINQKVNVRPASPEDYDDWQVMWKRYCAFYEEDVPDSVHETTWERIHAAEEPIHSLIAENSNGKIIGFANYLVHASTWYIEPVCYLNDLFVFPDVRRGGVGRSLIEHLIVIVKDNGWGELYWHTKHDNHVARILYDRVATDCNFVRYGVDF